MTILDKTFGYFSLRFDYLSCLDAGNYPVMRLTRFNDDEIMHEYTVDLVSRDCFTNTARFAYEANADIPFGEYLMKIGYLDGDVFNECIRDNARVIDSTRYYEGANGVVVEKQPQIIAPPDGGGGGEIIDPIGVGTNPIGTDPAGGGDIILDPIR